MGNHEPCTPGNHAPPVPAQHGCRLQYLLLLFGQLAQAGLNGHPDPLWDFQVSHIRAVPASPFEIELAAFHQSPANLFDKERVPFRLAVDAFQEFGRDLFVEQGCQQITGLIFTQPGQLDARRQPLPIHFVEHLLERKRFVKLNLAVGSYDQRLPLVQAVG